MNIQQQLPQDAYIALGKIAECESEIEVSQLVKFVISELGAKSYVYSTLMIDDLSEDRNSYRYFIGCNPMWCAIYNERKWFMNDPFVEYAKCNTEPVLGSKIVGKTPGQMEMLKVAAEHGFRSGMVIPTHSSHGANSRMGLLYVGQESDPDIGENILFRHKVFYRALGMELLDWWMRKLRHDAAIKFKLSEDEIELLQLAKNGLVVAEIGAKLNTSNSKIYRKMDIIKDKFNVDKINTAVGIANYAGLLG